MKTFSASLCAIALVAVMSASASNAQPSSDIVISTKADAIPEIQCDRFNCQAIERSSHQSPSGAPPPIDPIAIGPPGGQRFGYKVFGGCQAFTATQTGENLQIFTYFETNAIPVPLGSTHASITAMVRGYLGGSGPESVASIFGRLKVRRAATGVDPAGPWTNVDSGYVYTRSGMMLPSNRYGPASYQALVNMATFDGGTTLPSLINVAFDVFSISGVGFTSAEGSPAMCNGTLLLTF